MKNNSYKLSELISGKDAYYKQKTPLKIKKKFKLINHVTHAFNIYYMNIIRHDIYVVFKI